MHNLGSISAIASEKKIFLYFPIWSCVNTMTCGGGHLGFQIITKNTSLIRDHSMIIHAAQNAGADPGFQVRGGGHTYKNCAERREARKFLGYFV